MTTNSERNGYSKRDDEYQYGPATNCIGRWFVHPNELLLLNFLSRIAHRNHIVTARQGMEKGYAKAMMLYVLDLLILGKGACYPSLGCVNYSSMQQQSNINVLSSKD